MIVLFKSIFPPNDLQQFDFMHGRDFLDLYLKSSMLVILGFRLHVQGKHDKGCKYRLHIQL